jgi:hypothetical protein
VGTATRRVLLHIRLELTHLAGGGRERQERLIIHRLFLLKDVLHKEFFIHNVQESIQEHITELLFFFRQQLSKRVEEQVTIVFFDGFSEYVEIHLTSLEVGTLIIVGFKLNVWSL